MLLQPTRLISKVNPEEIKKLSLRFPRSSPVSQVLAENRLRIEPPAEHRLYCGAWSVKSDQNRLEISGNIAKGEKCLVNVGIIYKKVKI